ncbi:MAG: hypothetical protein A2297_02810 [Elusimicrobia bacterium RIFOXYB2_FULL_48_7]|nr:MAG: hypothetical protein A2297_02810 [Elusimicrobia bacterium RIFOXYB2_FULL_48_7]
MTKKKKLRKKPSVKKSRLQKLTSDLNTARSKFSRKIRRQAVELTDKNQQIKEGARQQVRSDEQITILTKAVESTSDGIFIIDAQLQDFHVIYANQAFQKMTGYAKTEIIGRNYFLFYGTNADYRIIDEIKQTILQGRVFHGEMFNFSKTGNKYWNLLRITPMRDTRGSVTHYIGIQTDVTLMRERDLELEEQREELLHVTRVGKLAEFVSSLAHEISQPLTAILSYAQAGLRMLGGKNPGLGEILTYIINDNHRAAEVIHRLRVLLKKNKPEIKSLDINALINETMLLMATDANVRNIFLKFEPESNLGLVRGDRIQLQQVLLNLISNSFDAMAGIKNSREILIHTACKNSGTVLVSVKDSGCGIPEENMPKLFTHFFTSKPDGLGMGLSISRSIIESHGGRLYMENNPAGGATFYFTIPVEKKEAL